MTAWNPYDHADEHQRQIQDHGRCGVCGDRKELTMYAVEITYNTYHDGADAPWDAHEHPRTLHGPFETLTAAVAWLDAQPEDTDVRDAYIVDLNDPRDRS